MAEGYRLAIDVCLTLGTMRLAVQRETTAHALGLVGPSGAGKTTLLRIIAGLERRAIGTVTVSGVNWQVAAGGARVPPWQRRVGWVPQEALLFPHLRVEEQLRYGGGSDSTCHSVSTLLELDPLLRRYPRHLSGGERQRVALGRALATAPRLLLLDEPFSALDRPLRLALIGRLAEYCRDQALPFVLVSHDERDVAQLAEEVWTMREGVVV